MSIAQHIFSCLYREEYNIANLDGVDRVYYTASCRWCSLKAYFTETLWHSMGYLVSFFTKNLYKNVKCTISSRVYTTHNSYLSTGIQYTPIIFTLYLLYYIYIYTHIIHTMSFKKLRRFWNKLTHRISIFSEFFIWNYDMCIYII